MKNFLRKHTSSIYPLVIFLLSLGVYFTYYGSPQAMFWDENYHVASAQKHIDGVMYMEPHPPLGKMLMAVGEVLFGGNSAVDKSKLDETDYLNGSDAPPEMTFRGFRWPSVVMMLTSVLFFFGILRRLTQRDWLAAAFTSLVIFDNAMVVHARAAMLEGIQMFFILGALYYFVRVITNHTRQQASISWKHYAILGIWIGLSIAIKVNGAILVILFVMLFLVDQWQAICRWQWLGLGKRLAITVPAGVLPLLLVFFGIFYIHIGMGQQVIKDRTYKASPEYLQRIKAGDTWSPSTFVIGMRDNWKYMSEYADGVPRLDVCKTGENGSYPLNWLIGKKTINYRWDKNTDNGKTVVHYKTLIGNPIVWLSVLAGMVLSCGLIIGRYVYGNAIKDEPLFLWICAFTALYLCYMIAIMQIERVMYLYHYLVPLVFGAINLTLVFTYLFRDQVLANNKHTIINVYLFALLVIGVFAFFSPFTYGFGLTEDQFALRDWFGFWQLQVVR